MNRPRKRNKPVQGPSTMLKMNLISCARSGNGLEMERCDGVFGPGAGYSARCRGFVSSSATVRIESALLIVRVIQRFLTLVFL